MKLYLINLALGAITHACLADKLPDSAIDSGGLRQFRFYGGFFMVRVPSEWEVLHADDDDSFPTADFRVEGATVSLKGYQMSRKGAASERYLDDLRAALKLAPNPDEWSWDKYHTWRVFRSRTTELGVRFEIRDYYAVYKNSHSHTYGIHVVLRYPADIEDTRRKRLSDGLTVLFANISIGDKR